MYKKKFYIVAKKDEDIESPNYHKLLALRSDFMGDNASIDNKWTDNIFIAKHFQNEKDATLFASKQLNNEFVSKKSVVNTDNETEYKIVRVIFDVDGNSEIISNLCTK